MSRTAPLYTAYRRSLMLAIGFAGADHILAGSDYPHQIGSIPLMLEAFRALPITDGERERLLGGNARALLGYTGA